MHIAFISNEYPHPLVGSLGGIGTSIQNLSKELIQQGHQVTIVGWNKEEISINDEGVRLQFFPATKIPKMGWFLNRKRLQKKINRMVRQEALEIVEAADWGGMTAGIRFDCPTVIRCNGTDTYFGNLLGYKPRRTVYWAEKMALAGADSIVAVSQFAANITKECFDLSTKIGVIPNGIPIEQFQSHPNKSPLSNIILYFGTLVRKKGVLDLMHIFSKVAKENKNAQLLLVGRDSIDKETGISTWSICQSLLDKDTAKRVEFKGMQPYSEIRNWIQQAHVCVFPSYAECLPLSWMEAMAMEKAIVASNIGWAKEMINDGVSGYLAHPGDHNKYANLILELLSNHAKSKSFGKAAREKVISDFDISHVARKSIDLYQSVISESKK